MSIILYGELYSSKNSKRVFKNGNQTIVLSSKKYLETKSSFLLQLKVLKKEWNKIIKNKEYPLKVSFFFYRKTARPFDYLNILQGLADQMVQMEFLPDDNMNYFLPVIEGWEKDDKNPRTIIRIN